MGDGRSPRHQCWATVRWIGRPVQYGSALNASYKPYPRDPIQFVTVNRREDDGGFNKSR